MALVYGYSYPLLYKILKLLLIRFFTESGVSPLIYSHSRIVHLVANLHSIYRCSNSLLFLHATQFPSLFVLVPSFMISFSPSLSIAS